MWGLLSHRSALNTLGTIFVCVLLLSHQAGRLTSWCDTCMRFDDYSGKNAWVKKETHDDTPELETLDPASPWSNYSEASIPTPSLICATNLGTNWLYSSQAQYGNRTIAWITKLVKTKQLPFFAFIGTSGPHLGVVPAPWHRRRTIELTVQAPRTPNFNMLVRPVV